MKFAAALIAVILLALTVPFLLPASKAPAQVTDTNLPWQIQTDGQGGSSVFGLRPGSSTLAEVRARFGPDLEVAIIATPDEVGSLEAYYAQVPLGFVLGRLILTMDLGPDGVTAMRERALKAEHMESTTRKITLHPDDLAAAERLPVRAVSLIPNVNLDEAAIVQRFGPPAEKIVVSENLTHLLYPAQGLDIAVDAKGKELLQYVAPRDFERLAAPLKTGAAKPAERPAS